MGARRVHNPPDAVYGEVRGELVPVEQSATSRICGLCLPSGLVQPSLSGLTQTVLFWFSCYIKCYVFFSRAEATTETVNKAKPWWGRVLGLSQLTSRSSLQQGQFPLCWPPCPGPCPPPSPDSPALQGMPPPVGPRTPTLSRHVLSERLELPGKAQSLPVPPCDDLVPGGICMGSQ